VGDFTGDGKLDLGWAGYVSVAQGRSLLPPVRFRPGYLTDSFFDSAFAVRVDKQGGTDLLLPVSPSPLGDYVTRGASVVFINPPGHATW
jgi:hypothetical protein